MTSIAFLKYKFSSLIVVGVTLCVGCARDQGSGVNNPLEAANGGSGITKSATPIRNLTPNALYSGDSAYFLWAGVHYLYSTGVEWRNTGGVGALFSASSSDANSWVQAATGSTGSAERGLVLKGRPGKWDSQLETAFPFTHSSQVYLYYSGYPDIGYPTNPGQIGLAIGNDPINFSRYQDAPILSPSIGSYDSDGLYSPVVFQNDTELGMIYTGHNYNGGTVAPGIRLLGATSIDGRTWQKVNAPVLEASPTNALTRNGVGESDLLKGADGFYYLFFTGNLGDVEKRSIGIARSISPFGPYQIRPTPLLESTPNFWDAGGVLAPSVRLVGDTLWVWYLAIVPDGSTPTGLALIPWKLVTSDW